MNFVFTITAHGFDKAAALEKSLKELKIPYEVVEKKGTSLSGRKRPQRITKVEVLAVTNCIAKNPNWSDGAVGKQTNVGANTVNRIRRGLHPLCKEVNVSAIKAGGKK